MDEFSNIDNELPGLLQKLLCGEALTEKEWQLLEDWKERSAANKALYNSLGDPAAVKQMLSTWHGIEKNSEFNKQRGMDRISELAGDRPPIKIRLLQRPLVRYAAAGLLLLGTGAYLWQTNRGGKEGAISQRQAAVIAPIAPGKDGAVLTLADGSTVVLDSLGNGVVAQQGGAQVMLQNGQLAYAGSADGEVAYNTISTPKGRQFRLQLPDGTRVWLNAASSVRYPVTFSGNERRVQLEGEAYFEIAKNANMPFRVAVGDATEVEVLGTSFNIKAYKNESVIKTTLLDGAVRLNAYRQSQLLAPGQQAEVRPAAAQLSLTGHADLDKVMAWKNGLFNFDDATLGEVMRELERWYDIEVTYAKGIPAATFGGEINKQNTLQDVLQILEKSNVHFRLEQGRKLVVIP
ncbi:FecR family protein [uncultured Chitinophaga sp.]|uniref:FecR family protein n=1 Tax=uncultured Chitinophaga sp. TaxID=339340 RepID=UPI0025D318CE|nr:FecR family protein [uncultured Chitinophaga sp.]